MPDKRGPDNRGSTVHVHVHIHVRVHIHVDVLGCRHPVCYDHFYVYSRYIMLFVSDWSVYCFGILMKNAVNQ